MKKALQALAHVALGVSLLCLLLAIIAKLGDGQLIGFSARVWYGGAALLCLYSIGFAQCGALKGAG